MSDSIGRLLRHLRANSNLTIREMAEKLGLSARHVSELETGKIEADAVELDAYAKFFALTHRPSVAHGVPSVATLSASIRRHDKDGECPPDLLAELIVQDLLTSHRAPSDDGEVVVTTSGKSVTVLESDRELARKCHEMVNDYVDCDEENAVRIALYRESFTTVKPSDDGEANHG